MPGRRGSSVSPSSPDPVHRWLDIFAPMTGLPKSQQAEIRAELEDHLRARVDDLMITGLSEPDAIQKAVEELGETAHLAKQFRIAHKPKRNTLMHAALIAIAGSALTLGVLSTTAPSTPAPQKTTQAAAEPIRSNAIPTDQYAFAAGGTIDMRNATLADVIEAAREQADRPLVIDWSSIEDIGIDPSTKIGLDAGEIPTDEALRLAIRKTAHPDFGSIAVLAGPNLIELITTDELDRRTTEIRTYDITEMLKMRVGPSFGDPRQGNDWRNAAKDIIDSVQEMVARETWVDYGGDLGTIQHAGSSLIIKTSARHHAAIGDFLNLLRAEDERLNAAIAAADERRNEAIKEQMAIEEANRQAQLEANNARYEKEQAERTKRREEQIAYFETELERVTREIAEIQAKLNASSMYQNEQNPFTGDRPTREEYIKANSESQIQTMELNDLRVIRETLRNELVTRKYGLPVPTGVSTVNRD